MAFGERLVQLMNEFNSFGGAREYALVVGRPVELRHFLSVERQMLRGGYRPVKLGSYKTKPARRGGLEGASVGNPGDACCEITVFIGLYGIMFKDARVYWLTGQRSVYLCFR